MENVARIVLGLEEHAVAEEVMHLLDRTGRTRIVATASDERQLAEAIRQLEPDAVVASPALVDVSETSSGSVLLTVDSSESVQSLRRALRAGARGFYLWPAERDELADAAALAAAQELVIPSGRDPAEVAAEYVARNDGELLECSCARGTFEATVRVRLDAGTLFLLGEARAVEAEARAVVDMGARP